MVYEVNKGIGRPVEFKGLTSQYLYILVGGLFADFVLAVILNVAGVPQVLTLAICFILASALIYLVFKVNKKYGTHGLMKLRSVAKHPDYLIHRKTVQQMLQNNKGK